VKNYGLLGAALAIPKTTVFSEDTYKNFELKAAALLITLISSHPLWCGNKRGPWLALNALLYLNGKLIEAYDLVVGMATDNHDTERIGSWLVKRLTSAI
jgi:death-on-curing protein